MNNKWISIEDVLPPIGTHVLATDGENVGEAYTVISGSEIQWHTVLNNKFKKLIAWRKIPKYVPSPI